MLKLMWGDTFKVYSKCTRIFKVFFFFFKALIKGRSVKFTYKKKKYPLKGLTLASGVLSCPEINLIFFKVWGCDKFSYAKKQHY